MYLTSFQLISNLEGPGLLSSRKGSDDNPGYAFLEQKGCYLTFTADKSMLFEDFLSKIEDEVGIAREQYLVFRYSSGEDSMSNLITKNNLRQKLSSIFKEDGSQKNPRILMFEYIGQRFNIFQRNRGTLEVKFQTAISIKEKSADDAKLRSDIIDYRSILIVLKKFNGEVIRYK